MSHVSNATLSRSRRSSFAIDRAVESTLETLESRRLFSGYAVTDLGLLWGDYAAAVGLTDSGHVGGHGMQADGTVRASLFQNGSNLAFEDFANWIDTQPAAMNANGAMAGTIMDADFNVRAAVFNTDGSVVDLGVLDSADPNDPNSYSQALGINNSGTVIGISAGTIETEFGPISSYYGFVYQNGQMTPLSLGGFSGSADKINDAGYVLGSADTLDGGLFAILYDGVSVQQISLGGSFSFGTDMNASGAVVGVSMIDANITQHAFLYSDGQAVSLHPSFGERSEARGINDAGQVIGNTFITEQLTGVQIATAFIHQDGTPILINPLAGDDDSRAHFITESGLVVGTSTDILFAGGGVEGEVSTVFLYENEVATAITPDGVHAFPIAVSESGQVVGTMVIDGVNHGFLWNGTDLIDLNTLLPADSGWTISQGSYVNAAGAVVAHATSADGLFTTAFLLTPDTSTEPQPPTIGGVADRVGSMLSDGEIDQIRGRLLVATLNTAEWMLERGLTRAAIATLGVARLSVEIYHRQGRISSDDYTILAGEIDTLIGDLIASLNA